MCGRFNITSDPMTELFMDLVGEPYPGETNLNTAPRQQAWVIREGENSKLQPLSAQWWLIPSWAKEKSSKYSMFNARCENLRKSPAFRGPFRTQRCAVPITGFYEWVNRNGQKQPYFIHAPEQNGLILAGLWDRWRDSEDGEDLHSFTIVTTNVVPDLKFLHHRQPVMLSKETAKLWVSNETSEDQLTDLFEPRIPYSMQVSPVSTYVNNIRNHGEECVEIIGDTIELPAVAAT